jgi:hypothetical protein
MATDRDQTTRDPRDVPAGWFAVLECARERGNSQREQEAIRELERLGVRVSFAKRKRRRERR